MALQQHTAQLTEKYDHLSAAYAQLKTENAQQKVKDAQWYAQQKAEHDQLREFVMNIASQSGDTCAPPPFWPYNNEPPPPPPASPLC
jgi:hypothetical protein